jgi:hypothetical protein
MNFLLTRDPARPLCSLGTLLIAELRLDSLERPWVPDPLGGVCGEPDLSCVPLGLYDLVLHDTAEHPKTWALVNPALGIFHEPAGIPLGQRGRFACLIHPGNWAWQSIGCVLPGLGRAPSGHRSRRRRLQNWMVTDSDVAMEQIRAAVPWAAGHTMEIRQS